MACLVNVICTAPPDTRPMGKLRRSFSRSTGTRLMTVRAVDRKQCQKKVFL